MANRNQKESENLSRDQEQPDGWFDPESYRRNLGDREHRSSSYQQTNNPNMRNRYDDLNRQRVQANYGNRSAFDRQYGVGREDSRSTYNNPDNPSTQYGDSFDEGYSARGNQRSYRNDPRGSVGNRSGMGGRAEDRSWTSERESDNFRDRTTGREDRDWWDRATDEVSSWFGDDDAERRRRMDKMQGPHSGKGPKGYTRTDEKLKDEINERLYHDSHIDASDIEVTVLNGDVTLTGMVESKLIKRRIEDIIELIPGIKDVENRLKIKSTSNTVGSYSSSDPNRKGGTNGS